MRKQCRFFCAPRRSERRVRILSGRASPRWLEGPDDQGFTARPGRVLQRAAAVVFRQKRRDRRLLCFRIHVWGAREQGATGTEMSGRRWATQTATCSPKQDAAVARHSEGPKLPCSSCPKSRARLASRAPLSRPPRLWPRSHAQRPGHWLLGSCGLGHV